MQDNAEVLPQEASTSMFEKPSTNTEVEGAGCEDQSDGENDQPEPPSKPNLDLMTFDVPGDGNFL